jgi:hypothetical protein
MQYNVFDIESLRYYAKDCKDLQFHYRPRQVKADFWKEETVYDVYVYGLHGKMEEVKLITLENIEDSDDKDSLFRLMTILREGKHVLEVEVHRNDYGTRPNISLKLKVISAISKDIEVATFDLAQEHSAEVVEKIKELEAVCRVQNWAFADTYYVREFHTEHGVSSFDRERKAVFTPDHRCMGIYTYRQDGHNAANTLAEHLRKPRGEYYTMPIWNDRGRVALFREGSADPLPPIFLSKESTILKILNQPIEETADVNA